MMIVNKTIRFIMCRIFAKLKDYYEPCITEKPSLFGEGFHIGE